MAILKVNRQTLAGDCEAYEFDVKGVKFLVKNLSANDCLVNFEEITNENEGTSILVPSKTAQIVLSCENSGQPSDTIYVKGTGDVEVQVVLW